MAEKSCNINYVDEFVWRREDEEKTRQENCQTFSF